MSHPYGKVYLVGAGPSSLAYLTFRGQQLLNCAQVLIYDALVDPQLLTLVSPHCLKIYVGKRGGKPSTPQTQINQLLVKYCQEGKQVVRLKSGDPLIFGRSRAEIEALTVNNCPFELVPGISSALAAPLLAGIPLTDKHLSSCFAVFSAHQPHRLDWSAIAQLDTLVILMGGRNLPQIVQHLQVQGKLPTTPVAIIRNCGRREQQIWRGTLVDIVAQTTGISLSPAVIVIGEVVGLQTNFPVIPSLPLTGKTILITRAAKQSSNFTQLLQQQGATVLEMPALEIRPPSSWQNLDEAINNLSTFHWLILTSGNGVEYFFNRLNTLGKDTRALAGIKIAVVGKKTAAVLKKQGLKPDFIPPNFVADSLVENFPEPLSHQKVLFPRVETGGRPILVQELTAQGAQVVEVAAYESGCPEKISPVALQALQQQKIDIVTFASAKTVKNFSQLLEEALCATDLQPANLLCHLYLASIGPQTSQACKEVLGRVDIEAQEYTLEGLTQGIIAWVKEQNKGDYCQ